MNLANALTLSRILVVPIIALLLIDGGFWPSFAAAVLFIIAANWLGKYKTAFQIAACIPLLFPSPFLTAQMHTAGLYFLWIATFFAVWSGWDYVYDYFRQAFRDSAA